MRVEHRGWTNYRVVGAACLIVAGCVALGYAWAALASRPWLKRLEATNLVAAALLLLAIIALTTPIADPGRLSVNDQMARLQSGRVIPAEFDFSYLRFDTGRYGREALERLKGADGPNADAIRQSAERALALTNRHASRTVPIAPDLAGMTVFPAGQVLPQSFTQQNWSASGSSPRVPRCLVDAAMRCEAFVTEGNGGVVIIVVELTGAKTGVLFQLDAGAVWQPIGTLSNEVRCESVRQALRAGEYRWVAPRHMELEAAGQRLTITLPWRAPICP